MQALLLDTHVWLWLVTGDHPRMSSAAWTALAQGADRNGLAVSEVSFWEIALKCAKRRLVVAPNTREWLKKAGRTPGLGVVQLDRDVLIRSTELDIKTRDPADRMLVATALRYDLRLATADQVLIDYAENNRVPFLDCRNHV